MRRLLFLVIALFLLTSAYGQKLALEDCIKLAMQRSPDLRIADMQLKDAKSAMKGSYGTILPHVSFGSGLTRQTQGPKEYIIGGYAVSRGDTTTSYFDAGVSYYQNLYDGGKWWNTIKLAKNSYDGVVENRDLSRQVLISTVTEKFYEVLKAQELLKVYQKSLESSSEQVSKTEQLLKIGQVAQKDLFKAQVNEGNDKLNVVRQKAVLKSSLSALNIAMGRKPNEMLEVYEDVYKQSEVVSVENAVTDAINDNRALKALRIDKQTAFLNYKVEKGNMFPAISGSFSYNRGGSEFSKLFSEFDKSWNTSLGLNISYPIFSGFYRRSKIQQQYINYQTYDDRIEKKIIEIQNDIQDLVLALNTYREIIEINEINIVSAEEDLRLANEMYKLNSATLLEVLDAQVALTRAQWNLITTKYDAKIAEVRLALITGNL